MPYRLGRRAPDPEHAAVSLKAGDYLKFRALDLTPPAEVDHFSRITDWGLYENDTYEDCGPTAAANMRKMVSMYVNGVEESPSQQDVFDLYRLQNPGFDPTQPGGPGDNGVDLQTMCEDLVKAGIGGVKALGFASINVQDLQELQECVTLFGAVILGVNLEQAQEQQTNDGRPWTPVRNSAEWGKHAVLYGSFNPTFGWVITWAQAQALTALFEAEAIEEGWAIIWEENLKVGAFMRGVDLPALAADYEQLTGRKFPVDITPLIPPSPVDPSPAPDVPAPPAPEPKPEPAPGKPSFAQRIEEIIAEAEAAAAKNPALVSEVLSEGRALVDELMAHSGKLDAWLKKHGV